MKQFVEVTDDVLYRQDGLPGPLVPYQCGVSCWHELRDSPLSAADPIQAAIVNDGGALSA